MKRIGRHTLSLSLALGAVGLVALLLVLAAGPQPAASADGKTIKVPDDYGTIQAAIDAATDGDTILVATGTYPENLSIAKGLTLSGGWAVDFTERYTGTSVIDGRGLGRVISITCATSDTVVIVDGFTVQNGDATGQGAPPALDAIPDTSATLLRPDLPRGAGQTDSQSLTGEMARLRAHLADVTAGGLYPGGEDAYQALLAQLDWLEGQAVAAHARASAPAVLVPDEPPQAYDFGGGVYSYQASLQVRNSILRSNIASRQSNGVGGGIYAGQAARGGVIIEHNIIRSNVASAANAQEVKGMGGGLYLDHAPGATVVWNEFDGNHGAEAGLDSTGWGGAIAIWSSSIPELVSNFFDRNTANLAWDGGIGAGGAIYLRRVDGAVVEDNRLNANLAALRGGGEGGGLWLSDSQDVLVTGNQGYANTALHSQSAYGALGGGIFLFGVRDSTIQNNTLRSNVACVHGLRLGPVMPIRGGGLYGEHLADTHVTGNGFYANVGSLTSGAWGGGAHILSSQGTVLSKNEFTDNLGTVSDDFGGGGGLSLEITIGSQVRHNAFRGNRAGTSTDGLGGGLYLPFGLSGYRNMNATVEANSFVYNAAAASPDDGAGGACADELTQGLTFRNNVVAGNVAGETGGVSFSGTGQGQVVNNTVAANSDIGLQVTGSGAELALVNNIVVSHTVGLEVTEGNTATVRYTLWHKNGTDINGAGTISHTHPVTGAPAFVDPAHDNYHLTTGSAALDAGDPAGVPPAPPIDRDGVTRPQGPAVDIGAYEMVVYSGYLPIVARRWGPAVGWAAGDSVDGYGVILHTTDGGVTWVRQGKAGEIPKVNFQRVSAIDAQNAWVTGSSGTILRTRDGGRTWERQDVPDDLSDAALFGVYALDRDTAWVTGNPGIILHTTDAGRTWTRQGLGTVPAVHLEGVYASDADHAWVVGGNEPGNKYGTILRTADGGNTWQRMPYTLEKERDDYYLIDIHGEDANTVWAVGRSLILHTSDGGDNWVDQTPDGAWGWDVNGVFAVDRNTSWAVQDAGGIYRSDNAGRTWKTQSPPLTDFVMRISAVDKQSAWAVTVPINPRYFGAVFHTADGGQKWTTQTTPALPEGFGFGGVSFVR